MTEPRYYHDASTLNDGTVLISGGSDIVPGTRAKATAEIYDPTTAAFAATGSMNAARVWHTSTVLQNGKVLITGGADSGSIPMASAEIYQRMEDHANERGEDQLLQGATRIDRHPISVGTCSMNLPKKPFR